MALAEASLLQELPEFKRAGALGNISLSLFNDAAAVVIARKNARKWPRSIWYIRTCVASSETWSSDGGARRSVQRSLNGDVSAI